MFVNRLIASKRLDLFSMEIPCTINYYMLLISVLSSWLFCIRFCIEVCYFLKNKKQVMCKRYHNVGDMLRHNCLSWKTRGEKQIQSQFLSVGIIFVNKVCGISTVQGCQLFEQMYIHISSCIFIFISIVVAFHDIKWHKWYGPKIKYLQPHRG